MADIARSYVYALAHMKLRIDVTRARRCDRRFARADDCVGRQPPVPDYVAHDRGVI